MGFGLLFIGYVLSFGTAFIETYFCGDVLGAILMIIAFVKLSGYNKAFRLSIASASIYTVACAIRGYLIFAGESGIGGGEVSTRYSNVSNAQAVTVLLLYLTMLYGIRVIAGEVELKNIVVRSIGLVVMFCLYFAVFAISHFAQDSIKAYSEMAISILMLSFNLFGVFWFVAVMLLLLSCLKWIAPAEVVEAENSGKEVESGVLTRLGGKMDKLEEKATKKYDPLNPKRRR